MDLGNNLGAICIFLGGTKGSMGFGHLFKLLPGSPANKVVLTNLLNAAFVGLRRAQWNWHALCRQTMNVWLICQKQHISDMFAWDFMKGFFRTGMLAKKGNHGVNNEIGPISISGRPHQIGNDCLKNTESKTVQIIFAVSPPFPK